MPLETEADRQAMLAALGEPATVGTASVKGIFERDFEASLGIESNRPALHVSDADVPGVRQGDAVSVRGASYTVASVHPDGTGMTTLILEAV